MAVTDAYATAAEYRASINKVDTGADTQVLVDLTNISRFIDKECGRFFTKDAVGVARDFMSPHSGTIFPEAENPYKYARGGRILHVDDLSAAPTAVVIDEDGDGTPETSVASTVYTLLPLNSDKGSEPRPYTALWLHEGSTMSAWPAARIVRITAQWGWPSVPGPIKAGCIQLTSILRLESPHAVSQTSPDTGEILRGSSKAMGIIRDLVRNYTKAAL